MICARARTFALGAAFLLSVPLARAGSVHGQVTLPVERVEVPDGLWRLDNGVLPVTPRTADARSECFVLLVPKVAPKEPKPETAVAELRGLRLVPSLIAVAMGGTVELHNEDRVPHSLSAEDVLPAKATPAGATRTERVQRPGIYALHDDELPHVHGWLVVTEGGTVVRTDEHGAWKAELTDGKYTAKLFYRGAFVGEHPFEVGARTAEVDLTATGAKP